MRIEQRHAQDGFLQGTINALQITQLRRGADYPAEQVGDGRTRRTDLPVHPATGPCTIAQIDRFECACPIHAREVAYTGVRLPKEKIVFLKRGNKPVRVLAKILWISV